MTNTIQAQYKNIIPGDFLYAHVVREVLTLVLSIVPLYGFSVKVTVLGGDGIVWTYDVHDYDYTDVIVKL